MEWGSLLEAFGSPCFTLTLNHDRPISFSATIPRSQGDPKVLLKPDIESETAFYPHKPDRSIFSSRQLKFIRLFSVTATKLLPIM